MNRQIRILGVALLVLFGALFVQLTNLQVVQSHSLRTDPRNTRQIVIDFSKDRGRILAADGSVLAQSVPTTDDLKRQRVYTNGPLWAPVTGYFSFNYGTDGLERQYNDQLAGQTIAVTDLGSLLTARSRTKDVTTTLLPAVQQAAVTGLAGRRGAVVALDPRTGAILALASTPTFDPNALAGHDLTTVRKSWEGYQADKTKPMLPRPYRERYSPGSTFKVVTATAAVERAPELVGKRYPQLRTLDLAGTTKDLPNFGGESCGGDLAALLKVSCNTGFGQVGLDLGAQRLRDEAQAFGFNDRPPIDLPAGARSFFPDLPELKTQPQLATSAIGQLDVSASPLQMALVSAAIGNGGTIMVPHLMTQITDQDGTVVSRYEPKVWKQATTPEAARLVNLMMVGVVNGGTATAAAVPGTQVGAKTGTAQTTGDNAHAWLIAMAPAGGQSGTVARVAVAVIVESQPGLGDVTGGRIAAPIARQVLAAALPLVP